MICNVSGINKNGGYPYLRVNNKSMSIDNFAHTSERSPKKTNFTWEEAGRLPAKQDVDLLSEDKMLFVVAKPHEMAGPGYGVYLRPSTGEIFTTYIPAVDFTDQGDIEPF